MTTDSPIVVGVDGSAHSLDAVCWAADAAVHHRAPLSSLLGAPGTFGDAVNLSAGVFSGVEYAGTQSLATASELARRSVPGNHLTLRTSLRHGSAVAALLDAAESARMLVVGSRGLGEFTGGLVGSVSAAVASHAPCPVAVIRGMPEMDAPPLDGPVVVGVDGSPNSEPAIAAAFEEASLRGVDLVAVHAWSDFSLLTVTPADPSDNELPWSAIETAERAVLSERLAGWKDKYPDVSVRKVVVRDRPVHHLLQQARESQLVVTGSRGRGGFASLLLGSTSRALLHALTCPLLIVRR
ncbi:possible universal stress protein [Rhodococcus jostii RHA1]|uniref:Possible universal stress protein n=1 Tax=Rhodococcus jostii (strain RHA1) TaxID=101510 RepID=Q0SKN9_RHOJR|nr:universal stress protein [Rhodococcus jostii]ABG91897.1 possible universal stress protein [Rhodococcus jostii RHA1]